jgi:hypothetical protein
LAEEFYEESDQLVEIRSGSSHFLDSNVSHEKILSSGRSTPLQKSTLQVYSSILAVDDSVLNLLGLKSQLYQIREIKN